jgi:hypothetical protein
MEKKEILFLIIIVALVAVFAAYNYIFSIYEINYKTSSHELYADNQSTVTIDVFPVNALGFRAPFRKSKVKFQIAEGKDLVDIIKLDESKGIIILRAKHLTGMVVVNFKSVYSLFPSSVEIHIVLNTA